MASTFVRRRYEDWDQRLSAYLDQVGRKGWDPVAHNCALFVLGAMRAILPDADARFRALCLDLPESPMAAARLLALRGGVRGLAQAFFASELQPVLFARRGDVLLADGNLHVEGSTDRESLGISDGSQVLFVGANRLERFSLTDCRGCWLAG